MGIHYYFLPDDDCVFVSVTFEVLNAENAVLDLAIYFVLPISHLKQNLSTMIFIIAIYIFSKCLHVFVALHLFPKEVLYTYTKVRICMFYKNHIIDLILVLVF